MRATGLFESVQVRRYLWEQTYTTDEYVALLNTYSDHRAREPGKRERLYHAIRQGIAARPGSAVRKHYPFVLHVAQRRDRLNENE